MQAFCGLCHDYWVILIARNAIFKASECPHQFVFCILFRIMKSVCGHKSNLAWGDPMSEFRFQELHEMTSATTAVVLYTAIRQCNLTAEWNADPMLPGLVMCTTLADCVCTLQLCKDRVRMENNGLNHKSTKHAQLVSSHVAVEKLQVILWVIIPGQDCNTPPNLGVQYFNVYNVKLG